MSPVALLEPNLGCRRGDDRACDWGAHPGPVVVDVKVESPRKPRVVAVRSPYHQGAWLMEECKTARGWPAMASIGPGPAVEECCVHIVECHRPTRQELSDAAGGHH
jgi:hypothetical protein